MDQLLQIVNNPLVFHVLVVYWVFSALASLLPSTAVVSNRIKSKPLLMAYGVLFTIVHAVAGSLARIAVAFKVPGAELPPDATN